MKSRTNRSQKRVKSEEPLYRSQAVARLAGVAVGTLRVWERRYGLGGASRTPTGHRLYDGADVERIALLKQLTGQGHAIGSIVGLDAARLRALASARSQPPLAYATRPAARLVVVGQALAQRLQAALASAPRGGPPAAWRVVAVFADAADAARGPAAADAPRADAVLVAAPFLPRLGDGDALRAAQAWRARRVGLVYGFASQAAVAAQEQTGAWLLREACDDATLLAWVQRLAQAGKAPAARARRATEGAARAPAAVAPRRYDDLTLGALAARRSDIACECPRHVADLLMQLAHFEAYSRECANRNPADARLHGHLHHVAATARALFEEALERVAEHEGLGLAPAAA